MLVCPKIAFVDDRSILVGDSISYPTLKKDSGPRMLIIGDSFTQAIEVSNDKTYYQYIADSLGFAVLC